MPISSNEEVLELTKQLRGVSCRLEELAPLLNSGNSLYEDMYIDELMYAQKLIIALTKSSVPDRDDEDEETEEVEEKPREDSAFMPGELNDVIGEEDTE